MALPVAVLIINYRVYEELDGALTSLRPFLRTSDEVVVVDQESDAGRLAAIERRHPAVTFVPTRRNVGFAAGVNLAARHSSAPLLLLLNPDTVIEGPVIASLERWLHDHPETAVVGPRVLNGDGSIQASARRFPGPSTAIAGRSTWLTTRFPRNWLSKRNLPAQDAAAPTCVDWIAGSCLMTRRSVFDLLRGFDESFFLYWEDADFCRRAATRGGRCVYLPTVSVKHAGGRSAALNPGPAIRAFHRSAFVFHRKHAGPIGRALAPLVHLGLWSRGELLARIADARWRRTMARPSSP
jgi:N-acetylglucosaminyl-diphospho-decaprenol L-rhamnosyltransferase